MSDQKKKVLSKLRTDLRSDDEAVVLKALKTLQKHGDATILEATLELYRDTSSSGIKNKLFDILNSLKVTGADQVLMNAAVSEDFIAHRAEILSFLWNSGMYPSEYILDIVKLALQGDYMVAVEAMTLIENMIGPFEPDYIEEAIFETNQFLEENEGDLKFDLISDMYQQLQVLSDGEIH
jgi:hypothetical protein